MYSPNTRERGCLPGGRDEEARNRHNTSAAPQRLPADDAQVRARLIAANMHVKNASIRSELSRQAATNAMLTVLLVCQVLDAQGLVSDEYPGAMQAPAYVPSSPLPSPEPSRHPQMHVASQTLPEQVRIQNLESKRAC